MFIISHTDLGNINGSWVTRYEVEGNRALYSVYRGVNDPIKRLNHDKCFLIRQGAIDADIEHYIDLVINQEL